MVHKREESQETKDKLGALVKRYRDLECENESHVHFPIVDDDSTNSKYSRLAYTYSAVASIIELAIRGDYMLSKAIEILEGYEGRYTDALAEKPYLEEMKAIYTCTLHDLKSLGGAMNKYIVILHYYISSVSDEHESVCVFSASSPDAALQKSLDAINLERPNKYMGGSGDEDGQIFDKIVVSFDDADGIIETY